VKRFRHHRRSHGTKVNGAIVVRSMGFLLLVAVCVFAIRWISNAGSTYARQSNEKSSQSLSFSALAGLRPEQITSRNRRLVYPYSVVPGGVISSAELREAAAHDPVVAGHYANFDYHRARIVQVNKPQLVYLSYRRGNKVYWTHKQASLHPGEKLLTDGRTTARTRCANQVSVLPKAETSPEEPTLAELERPDAVASGTTEFPNPHSTLAEIDPGVPGTPGSSGGFGPPSGFVPMPIAGPGGGTNGTTPPPSTGGGGGCTEGNCNPPPPPAPVPEPGTLLLVASGAVAIVARLRSRS
jgi:hypothetical protein